MASEEADIVSLKHDKNGLSIEIKWKVNKKPTNILPYLKNKIKSTFHSQINHVCL